MRRVDPLFAEVDRRFAKPFPGVFQVFGKVLGQRGFGRGPAIMRLVLLDPLPAVEALVGTHISDSYVAVRQILTLVSANVTRSDGKFSGSSSWPDNRSSIDVFLMSLSR